MNVNNNKGALTILMLVMLSGLFIVMMGTAGVKLMEAAKNLRRSNEALNHLTVMEELGQAVARARSLGRNVDCLVNPLNPAAAPTGAQITAACQGALRLQINTGGTPTTLCPGHPVVARRTRNQYTLCVPDRNGNGTVDAVEFCTQMDGSNYCLSGGAFNSNLQRLDLTNEFTATDYGRPVPYVEIGGAASQQTPSAILLPRNNQESWSPDAAWPDNNEIFTTDCGAYTSATNNSRYWLGCHFCADPRVECWAMRMCPKFLGAPGTCPAAERVTQRFVLYFENNRR